MARSVTVGTTPRVYFEVRQLDLQTPATGEAGGQPEYSLNGGGFNPVGLTPLVAIGFGRYYADLDAGLVTTPGDEFLTRYASPTCAESWGDTLVVVAADGKPTPDPVVNYYGSVVEGDQFFTNSLRGASWKAASVEDRQAALNDATQIIDRLNFAGNKADPNQTLQFPRGNSYTNPQSFWTGMQVEVANTTTVTADVNVPTDIKRAAYLIADKLLDGWDPDIESDQHAAQSTRYGGVTTSFNREYIPEHMRAGIPSAQAWGLLRPYVRDPYGVELVRAN